MDERSLWLERVGDECPDESTRISWYRRNQPDHPENLEYNERRRLRKLHERQQTHEARVEKLRLDIEDIRKKAKLERTSRADNARRDHNIDFNKKLNLGLKLKLQLSDPSEYLDMPYVLEQISSIAQLEDELMITGRLNREWFRSILPNITDGNYQIVGEVIQLITTLAVLDHSDEEMVLMPDQCENFSYHENGEQDKSLQEIEYISEPFTDISFESLVVSNTSVYYNSSAGPRFINASKPILGITKHEYSDITSEELFRLYRLLRKTNPEKVFDESTPDGFESVHHIKRGVWISVVREIQYRYHLPVILQSSLKSQGLQKMCADIVVLAIKNSFRSLTPKLAFETLFDLPTT